MNIFNPIQKENEVIYEMDEMDAIDISNIFLCEICYEYGDDSKKIKCNNDKCNKYMCENCFENWSKKHKKYKCVYCTNPLEISDMDLDIENNDTVNRYRTIERQPNRCILVFFLVPTVGSSCYLIGVSITQSFKPEFIVFNFMLGLFVILFICAAKVLCCCK